MNRFNHFLHFTTGAEAPPVGDSLPARAGDRLRVLVPKRELGGCSAEQLQVVWMKDDKILEGDVGRLRLQDSERYTLVRLWVWGTPSEESYKQFALTRRDGSLFLGTFRGQQTDLPAYMAALKQFYEGYPFAPVRASVRGNVLTLRIYHSPYFRFQSEELTVGLGRVLAYNDNHPSLTKVKLAAYEKPAQTVYRIRVGSSVQEGNVFYLNGKRYTAQAGDTAEIVLQALNDGQTTLVLPEGTLGRTGAEKGTKTVRNVQAAQVVALFHSVNGGNDRYRIRVQESLRTGNIIQISASGKITLSYVVAEGDTLETVEAMLNPDGGYYEVAGGVLPEITSQAGTHTVANVNLPSLEATIQAALPAETMQRWRIIVGSDVQPGNRFTYEGKTYIAGVGDTATTVAEGMGLPGPYATVEFTEGYEPEAYARRGYRYNETRHKAAVGILTQLRHEVSSQVVLDVTIPEGYQGCYHIGLFDPGTGEIIARSNGIFVDEHEDTQLVEVSDSGAVFGYEYYEEGLSQRLRLPVSIKVAPSLIEQSNVEDLDGTIQKQLVRIIPKAELVSQAIRKEQADTLLSWLLHDTLIIGAREYASVGAVETEVLSQLSQKVQVSAELVEEHATRDNRDRLLPRPPGYGRLEVDSPLYGLQLWLLINGRFQPVGRQTTLPAGEYGMHIQGGADDCRISHSVSGVFRSAGICPCLLRSRYPAYIRIEPGGVSTLTIQPVQAPTFDYTCEPVHELPVTDYTCEQLRVEQTDTFGEEFSEDFNVGEEPVIF